MAEERSILCVTQAAFPGRACLDTAFSHALLREVAEGRAPACLRVYRPDEVVAFSLLDRRSAGFSEAVGVADELGFESVLRLAGGRAALFHRSSLAFAWCRPDPEPRAGVETRYREISGLLVRALRNLGVDARVGEVPDEYCPGRFSVNARGCVKLAGVGQRLVAGASYVGGVLVVDAALRAREVLDRVYQALGLPLDPGRIGSVAEEAEGASLGSVLEVFLAELGRHYELRDFEPSSGILERAGELAPGHEVRLRSSFSTLDGTDGRAIA